MEEESWVRAACQVLSRFSQPMHYSDIKRSTLEHGLISPGFKTTLEMALFKESQKPNKRVFVVDGQPGVFALSSAPQELSMRSIEHNDPSHNTPVRLNGVSGKADRYYTKYRRLKRLVKQTVFLNSAICDEVARLEEKVTRVKDERKYLLRRLLQHQAVSEAAPQGPGPGTPSSTMNSPAISSPSSTSLASHPHRSSSQSVAQLLGEAEKRKKKAAGVAQTAGSVSATLSSTAGMGHMSNSSTAAVSGGKGKKKVAKESIQVTPAHEPKPKGKKGKAVKRFVTPIPLDNTGRPIFPIELGSLTVYCLGEINPKPGYHSPECIYPIGFCSTREYISLHEPTEKCLYTCKVSDDDHGALFELSAEDSPEQVISGASPDICHLKLIHAINTAIGEEAIPNNIRGAEFFGLCHPTIQNLIQYCSGAKKCQGYRWVKFEIAKDGAPHVEEEATVNVEIILANPLFLAGLSNRQQRLGVGSGSLRNLLTGSL